MSKRKSVQELGSLLGLGYFLDLQSPQSLNPKDYVEFRRAENPDIRDKKLVNEWHQWSMILGEKPKWKNAFSSVEALTILSFRSWRKSASLPAPRSSSSFLSESESAASHSALEPISESEPALVSASTSALTETSAAAVSTSSSSSLSSASSASSASSTTTGTLTQGAIDLMNAEYTLNFKEYQGLPWQLPNGVDVDNVIYQYVLTLNVETLLHSFILDDHDLKEIGPCFNAEDKPIFEADIKFHDSKHISPVLPEDMQKEIFKYPLSSIGLRKQLSKGWTEADESPTLVGPSCNISSMIYRVLYSLITTYDDHNNILPKTNSESWLNKDFWRIFIRLLIQETDHLSYRPGEICSVASANRINRDRSICGRKASGSKVDGIFTIGKGRLEIAVIEMSRNFEEPTSTKALKDARKLGKVMKDMFDNIYLECNSEDDIMGKLEVFGLLMSGPRVEILSLRYLKGRFFRLKRECSLTIPPELTDDSIGEIMKTITRFLKLRVRMENMAKLVKHWKSCNSAKLKEVMLETECEANKTEHIKTLSAPKN